MTIGIKKSSGVDYVNKFYQLCLDNEDWFNLVSNGARFVGDECIDLENINTSNFARFAASRSDKPIQVTYAERIFRQLRAKARVISVHTTDFNVVNV